MTSETLTVYTVVGEDERPVIIAALQQLSTAVNAALGHDWPITLVLSDVEGHIGAGSILIASLIEDVQRSEAIEVTMQRWLERIERWSQQGQPRILLPTLFRKLSPVSGDRTTIERLRRLNMMALHLSRRTGIEIVDVDRLFALCGARTLGTDYRCQGAHAAALGGHAIAAAIFAGGLDDFLEARVQEAAAMHHGGAQDIATILQRRIGTS